MRSLLPPRLEWSRIKHGPARSDASYGANGAFSIVGPGGATLKIIASNGEGWEHVSVSVRHRTPNWREMCFVKDLFWDEDECVIQYHPPRKDYVNCHPNCLHLWKPIGVDLPQPDAQLVGPREKA